MPHCTQPPKTGIADETSAAGKPPSGWQGLRDACKPKERSWESLPWRVAVVWSHSVDPAADDKGDADKDKDPLSAALSLCASLAASKDKGADAAADAKKKHVAIEALGKLLLEFSTHELLWPCFNIHDVGKLSRLRIGLEYAPGAARLARSGGSRGRCLGPAGAPSVRSSLGWGGAVATVQMP
jgi:hypothetical protein